MFLRTTLSLPLAATVLLAFLGSYGVTSFTATPSRVSPMHMSPISATTIMLPHQLDQINSSKAHAKITTALHMNSSPPNKTDTGGLERGKYIFILVMVVNIWMFSIPTEFRRARFCSDEDSKLHADKGCTTFGAWRKGVAQYYANGGGVKFDFSIEGKE